MSGTLKRTERKPPHRCREVLASSPRRLLSSIFLFPRVPEGFDGIDANGPLLTGPFKPIDYFDPLVSLPTTIFFNHQWHHLFDPFIGGESARALGALASAPDHIAILAQA